jgi:hypothetical protein
MAEDFTGTEQEVIVLRAVWELIDEMVNYEMFSKPDRVSDVQLMPSSITHKRLFNILLVDFLSTPKPGVFGLPAPPPESSKSERSYLFYLRRICDSPKLNPIGNASLRVPLEAFLQWLETECLVEKVWLPSINLGCDLRLKRIRFIKICGNISKHNFSRLDRDVNDICRILKENGHDLDVDSGYLVIPEFYEWFHENILGYHISAIAEFLNNIRWGVYEYLCPEFERAYTRDDPESVRYRFIFPPDCDKAIAQTMYWDLMNKVRGRPYMRKFEVTPYLKMRY